MKMQRRIPKNAISTTEGFWAIQKCTIMCCPVCYGQMQEIGIGKRRGVILECIGVSWVSRGTLSKQPWSWCARLKQNTPFLDTATRS